MNDDELERLIIGSLKRCERAGHRAAPHAIGEPNKCALRRRCIPGIPCQRRQPKEVVQSVGIAGRDGAVIIWFFSYNMSLLVIRRAIPSAADVITKIVVLDRLQSTRRRQPPRVTVRLNQLD